MTQEKGHKHSHNPIDHAWENGCVIVAAATLENDSLAYPAFYEKYIAVTVNTEDNMVIPPIANGHWVDIAAPGIRIYSTLPNDSYGIRSGASCFTAFVSGNATLLFGTLEDGNKDAKLNEEIRITIENNYFDI